MASALYWAIVENRRCKGGRILQKTVLYLGEINDSQKEQWIRAIEVFDETLNQSNWLFQARRRRKNRAEPANATKRPVDGSGIGETVPVTVIPSSRCRNSLINWVPISSGS